MEKHKALADSFLKQEQQLERIGKIMAEYKPRMEEPAFKMHYSEQLEMYDYFKYLLKKYMKQQVGPFLSLVRRREDIHFEEMINYFLSNIILEGKSFY